MSNKSYQLKLYELRNTKSLHQGQREENRRYWTSNFEMSSLGRINSNVEPIEVLSTREERAYGKHEILTALGDSPQAKKYNKYSMKTRIFLPIFTTKEDAELNYEYEIKMAKDLLENSISIINEKLKVVNELLVDK